MLPKYTLDRQYIVTNFLTFPQYIVLRNLKHDTSQNAHEGVTYENQKE